MEPAADPPKSVLGKVVAVLRAFTVEDTVLGFAELARRTGLSAWEGRVSHRGR